MEMTLDQATAQIIAAGCRLDARGLAPATAGNYSARLGDGSIALTVSGAHKGRLAAVDIMRVDAQGVALEAKQPSAETLLHCLIYQIDSTAGAILHTHSVAGTVLSRVLSDVESIMFDNYEMLKIFPGITTHATRVAMPIVENAQDMPTLAAALRPILTLQNPLLPAFYIRGHGLYGWGQNMPEAENITEAVEFLLSCEVEHMKIKGAAR